MQTFAQKQKQFQPMSARLGRFHSTAPELHRRADLIPHWQRAIGNQAVQRLSQALRPEDLVAASGTKEEPRWEHDSSPILAHGKSPAGVLAKLAVSPPEDAYEQEADRVADEVMRIPESPLPRGCACGGRCPECQAKQPGHAHERSQTERDESSSVGQTAAPDIVHEVLHSFGQPLDPITRAFMEMRFDDDFGDVRVHTDPRAAASSRSIQALAYTAGHDIVFSDGRYAPGTESGKRLLAHELAHVVQQREGHDGSRIARFSDTDHNIIEEAALTIANLKPEEIEQIHKGNTKRDYSQSPAQLNLVLLCDPSNYGRYKAHEHFDNFRWDEALQAFQAREQPAGFGTKSPITHIDEELIKFVDSLPDKAAFQHVGSAFHAIEDFFAHSNFIELTHGDFQHGRELITGSVGGSDDVSLLKILESISSEETAPYYGDRANKETAGAPPKSHARMAKDYKSNRYYMEAVVLAGLVIQEMGAAILALESLATKDERIRYVREVIMTKVKRYLRPPDESDKWWVTLRASGGQKLEHAIRETAAKTPVTKNQCVLSPLRSIEASRDSNLKLLGPAFTVPTSYGHVLVQVGTGFSTTPAFAGPSGAVEPRTLDVLPVAVQITGRF